MLWAGKDDISFRESICDTVVLHATGLSIAFAFAFVMRHFATVVADDTADAIRSDAIREIGSVWQGAAEIVALMDIVYAAVVLICFGVVQANRRAAPPKSSFAIARAGSVLCPTRTSITILLLI